METRGNLGLEHQKHPVSFHQDAGDAENKTYSEGGLTQAARPVPRLPDENQRAGEAADEREQEHVGQLPVCGLNYRGVAKPDEDSHHEGCKENAQDGAYGQRYPKRLRPGQELDLLQEAERVVPIRPGVVWTLGANAGVCVSSEDRAGLKMQH